MTWARKLREYSDRKVFTGLALLLSLSLLTTTAAIISIVSLLQANAEYARLNVAEMNTRRIFTSVRAAESSQRAYVITGNEAYLEAYKAALSNKSIFTTAVEQEIRDPKAMVQFKQIKGLVQQKVEEMDATVSVRRDQGFDAAAALVSTDRGKDIMNQLQGNIESLLAGQEKDAQDSGHLASRLAIAAIIILAITVVLKLLLGANTYLLFATTINRERKLERAKDDFVSLASHQLRTPASGQKAILSMLIAGDFGELTEKQLYYLGRANETNERMLNLVEDLLNVARINTGRMTISRATVEVQSLLSDIIFEQKAAMSSRDQELKVDQPQLPIEVEGDGEKLHMALGNLLDNASKYTRREGAIKLRLVDANEEVIIEISDNGVGIPEGQLNEIFKQFVRLDNELSAEVGGTGLGLYLTKRIIELHHGEIKVTSKVGSGTVFRIVLPKRWEGYELAASPSS